MQPEHSNIAGNVHGGELMKLMDNAAGVAAAKHCKTRVVTARVDSLEFHHPVHIGDYVNCACELTFVGKTSMEVEVTVIAENLRADEPPRVALTGYFTLVSVDKDGKPRQVPNLEITNEEEARRFEEGKQRYLKYKEGKKSKV